MEKRSLRQLLTIERSEAEDQELDFGPGGELGARGGYI